MGFTSVGKTDNFDYGYQDSLSSYTPGHEHSQRTFAEQRAKDLLASGACEKDLATLESWFSTTGGFGHHNRISISIDPAGQFGFNQGYQTDGSTIIVSNPFNNGQTTNSSNESCQMVMVAELAEIMMGLRQTQFPSSPAWNSGDSMGEALSRVCAALFHPGGYYAPNSVVNSVSAWFNSSPTTPCNHSTIRADFVTKTAPTDADPCSYGCGVVFLYYLHTQLGYSIKSIITTGGSTFEKLYKKLTGRSENPHHEFMKLLGDTYPQDTPAFFPAPTPDNPFPLESVFADAGRVGDMDGDGVDEILVSSPWGIGILKKSGDSLTSLITVANGTRLGDWVLNTAHDIFGPVADFDQDGRAEIFVRSPWGIGLLRYYGESLTSIAMMANGTLLGDEGPENVVLNTAGDIFGPIINTTPQTIGLLYRSIIPIGILSLSAAGNSFELDWVVTGQITGGWWVGPNDAFGPVGNFAGTGANTFVITSNSAMGIVKFESGVGFYMVAMSDNGDLHGGWPLNTLLDKFSLAGYYQITENNPITDAIFVSGPWGIGVLWLGDTLTVPISGDTPSMKIKTAWKAKNGTVLSGGSWHVDTSADHYGPAACYMQNSPYNLDYGPVTNYEIFVKSGQGIGILSTTVPGSDLSITTISKVKNGDQLGDWVLDSGRNIFGSPGMYDGTHSDWVGQSHILVASDWGIGLLYRDGNNFGSSVMIQNGTRIGDWLLDTSKDVF